MGCHIGRPPPSRITRVRQWTEVFREIRHDLWENPQHASHTGQRNKWEIHHVGRRSTFGLHVLNSSSNMSERTVTLYCLLSAKFNFPGCDPLLFALREVQFPWLRFVSTRFLSCSRRCVLLTSPLISCAKRHVIQQELKYVCWYQQHRWVALS